LHEVAGGGNGAVDGVAAALFAAGIAARTKGQVLWCVTRQDLFAPALAEAGLAPDRVIYVEAGDDKAVLACFEEALRHAKLSAVVAEVSRLSMIASRRLQLRTGLVREMKAAGADRLVRAMRLGPVQLFVRGATRCRDRDPSD
jgi:protein ImuA